MKRLLLVLILLLPCQVFAHSFELKNTNYAICDEDDTLYPIHYLTYKNSPVYFLNLNDNYNYALGTYHEYIEVDDAFFLSEYLWAYPVVNFQTYYDYHMQFNTRLLWEDLYYEKTFNFCNEEEEVLERKEEEYQLVKNRVNKVLEGIDILNEDHIQYQGQSVIYTDDLLQFYTLVNDNGLDVVMDDNSITITGDVGEYFLDFYLKDNYVGNELTFTDGKNRLATMHHPPFNTYAMHVTILELEDNEDSFEQEQEAIILEETQILIEEPEEKEIFINIDDETENNISFIAKNTFVSTLF